MAQISMGDGSFCSPLSFWLSCTSSRMMSLHRSIHSSQMNTEGPAISLRTSCWLVPQKEQYSSLPLSSPFPVISDIKNPCLRNALATEAAANPCSLQVYSTDHTHRRVVAAWI